MAKFVIPESSAKGGSGESVDFLDAETLEGILGKRESIDGLITSEPKPNKKKTGMSFLVQIKKTSYRYFVWFDSVNLSNLTAGFGRNPSKWLKKNITFSIYEGENKDYVNAIPTE